MVLYHFEKAAGVKVSEVKCAEARRRPGVGDMMGYGKRGHKWKYQKKSGGWKRLCRSNYEGDI